MADSIRFRVQNIRMTNNIRVFLWLGLALAVWLNYSQWQMDYGPKAGSPGTATSAPGEPKPPSLDDTVPQANQPAAPAADAPPTAAVPGTTAAASAAPPAEAAGAGKVRVTTDVLVMDIDLRGGTLVYAELPAYPLVKGQAQPVVLLNQSSAATNYVLQSGLAGTKPDETRPTHVASFTSAQDHYELAAGQDELRVPLTWTDGNGVTGCSERVTSTSHWELGLETARPPCGRCYRSGRRCRCRSG